MSLSGRRVCECLGCSWETQCPVLSMRTGWLCFNILPRAPSAYARSCDSHQMRTSLPPCPQLSPCTQPWWNKNRRGKRKEKMLSKTPYPTRDFTHAMGPGWGEGEDSPLSGRYSCVLYVGLDILVIEWNHLYLLEKMRIGSKHHYISSWKK